MTSSAFDRSPSVLSQRQATPVRLRRAASDCRDAEINQDHHPPTLQALTQEHAVKLQNAGYSVAQGVLALQQSAPRSGSRSVASAQVAAEVCTLEEMARSIFGEEAQIWLRQAHPLLGGDTPASLMLAPCGRVKVRRLLKAYEDAS